MGNHQPRTRVWRKGKLEAEGFPFQEVSDYLEQEDTLVWADLCQPDHEDLVALAEELGLDPHAVEDAVEADERPKLDRYRGSAFLTVYAARVSKASGRLDECRVSAFMLPSALITVREAPWFPISAVTDRWDEDPVLTEHGVPGLLHGLLDVIVDGHLDALDPLDDEIESFEDILFEDRPMPREDQRRNFVLRKNLSRLRRVVLPMREVVNGLHRLGHAGERTGKGLAPELEPYYQDLYDHVLHAIETTDSLRDSVNTVFETNRALQDSRLNNTMRQLTSWAAIIAVPTAVTGFYGQNVPYPGFQHWAGFVSSTVIMLALAIGLFFYFRRKKWL